MIFLSPYKIECDDIQHIKTTILPKNKTIFISFEYIEMCDIPNQLSEVKFLFF